MVVIESGLHGLPPSTTNDRALLEMIDQGIVVLDVDGIVLDCNERFATMIGVPAFVVVHDSIDAYFSPRDAAAFRGLRVARGTTSRSGEFVMRAVDGAAIPVGLSVTCFRGDAGRLGVVVTDLRSGRKASQAADGMREHLANEVVRRKAFEARFERAALHGAVASWEVDLRTGAVVHAFGMDRVLGLATSRIWSIDEAIDAFCIDDRPAISRAFDAAPLEGSIDVEGRVDHPDGSRRRIRFSGSTVPGSTFLLAGLASEDVSRREVGARPAPLNRRRTRDRPESASP